MDTAGGCKRQYSPQPQPIHPAAARDTEVSAAVAPDYRAATCPKISVKENRNFSS